MDELRARLQQRAGTRRDVPDLSPYAATFLRGLSLGALVGAAIAGSAIWRRVRDARNESDDRRSANEGTSPSETG